MNTFSQGYKSLPFFKQAEIVYDFTVEFCQVFFLCHLSSLGNLSHLIWEQAARSGKQNIAEGYLQKSLESKIKLLGVSRGSFEELLNDYLDFLRQHKLSLWEKESAESQTVRQLVYNRYNNYNDYKSYIGSPEKAANAMICLINQTNMMLNQKIRWNQENLTKEDIFLPKEKWLRMQMEKAMEKDKEIDKELQKIVESAKNKI